MTAGQIGGGHPQHVAVGELAQPLHLLLQVLRVHGVQQGIQLGLQVLAAQGGIESARVDQLVEQQRLADDLLRDPGAHAGEPRELGEDAMGRSISIAR